jgi:predicted HTH domain antitoxin
MKTSARTIVALGLAVGLAVGANAQTRSITNGLVVHLTFDETMNDDSGRGNDAAYVSTYGLVVQPAAPTYVPGKLGKAFQFNTYNDGSRDFPAAKTSLRPNAPHCRVNAKMRLANTNPKSAESITVTVQMPKGIAPKFGANPKAIGRRVIEQAAVEGYRSYQLSRGQVRQLLGLDWAETEEFLARHRCERHYDREDLEEDRRNLDKILGPS